MATQVYSDLKFGFRKTSSGDLAVSYDENAIKQSLTSLFSTTKGQRLFNPEYGTRIPYLLFEPMDESTAKQLGEEIKDAVTTWEGSRIEIEDISVDVNYDTNTYTVNGTFLIKNTVDTASFSIKLEKQ